jgi:hypothetical protein
MEAYQQRAAALKRRPHQYSLEEFGLSPERVLDELGGLRQDLRHCDRRPRGRARLKALCSTVRTRNR